jgi:hypothetical protein
MEETLWEVGAFGKVILRRTDFSNTVSEHADWIHLTQDRILQWGL